MAGLNVPRLDVAMPHYGGAWASATTNVFLDLFKASLQPACSTRVSWPQ